MKKYLTKNGKNVIRQLYYETKCSELKYSPDPASSQYQALQQRLIAISDVFEHLITVPAGEIEDRDLIYYYDSCAKSNKQLKFNITNRPYITEDGIDAFLKLYQATLIALNASIHDGVFIYLPDLKGADDLTPTSINTNYLERIQGYRLAAQRLNVPYHKLRDLERTIRNQIYTLELDANGANRYVKVK